jgi:hypothetical protein
LPLDTDDRTTLAFQKHGGMRCKRAIVRVPPAILARADEVIE